MGHPDGWIDDAVEDHMASALGGGLKSRVELMLNEIHLGEH